MEKYVFLVLVLLAFVAVNQAALTSLTSKRKLSEETNRERSRLLEQLTRGRREIDYYEWQRFEPQCTSCNILSIGNGYKNKNYVTFNGPIPNGWKYTK